MKTYKIHDSFDSYEIFVGMEIYDDLTSSKAKIINITEDSNGNIGIWLDNDYFGGGGHPWEVTRVYIKKDEIT